MDKVRRRASATTPARTPTPPGGWPRSSKPRAGEGRASAKLYDELEVPLIEVLAELEFTGIRLDVPFLKKLGTEMGDELAGMETEIHALAGQQFNIALAEAAAEGAVRRAEAAGPEADRASRTSRAPTRSRSNGSRRSATRCRRSSSSTGRSPS